MVEGSLENLDLILFKHIQKDYFNINENKRIQGQGTIAVFLSLLTMMLKLFDFVFFFTICISLIQ
jgi:hypothetical protein